MTTSALLMLVATWTVILVINARFVWRVLTLPQRPGGQDSRSQDPEKPPEL